MNKAFIETPAEERGKLNSDRPGEYHYEEMADYVSLTASLLRRSHMKYNHIAKATGMSGSTASNLASGKTRFPRFSTIAGILGAMGYETVIRAGKKKP
jgi:DNA-binding Xre family transcriptional regulator